MKQTFLSAKQFKKELGLNTNWIAPAGEGKEGIPGRGNTEGDYKTDHEKLQPVWEKSSQGAEYRRCEGGSRRRV